MVDLEILRPCIYCKVREASPGEHTFPAALGRFQIFDDRKKILCKASPAQGLPGCNTMITGPAYDRLFRRGGLSLYRRHLDFGVGRSARGKKRSDGPSYEAPTFYQADLGVQLPVEIEQGGGFAAAMLGLVLEGRDGSRTFLPVPDHIKDVSGLRELVSRRNLDAHRPVKLVDDAQGRLRALTAGAFPDARIDTEPRSRIGGGPVTAELTWNIGPDEARSIAVLAFHMFIGMNPDISGGETQFRRIRNLIKGNGNGLEVVGVCAPGKLTPYEVSDELPERQKHLFILSVTPNGTLIFIFRLFASLGAQTPWWRVELQDGANSKAPPVAFAMAYYSGGSRRIDGREFDGEIILGSVLNQAVVIKEAGERLR
jgi:hypothetical protein